MKAYLILFWMDKQVVTVWNYSIVGQIIRHIYPLRVKLQMVFSRRAIPDQVWDGFCVDLSYILSLQYKV
jgi:hypothetical protein